MNNRIMGIVVGRRRPTGIDPEMDACWMAYERFSLISTSQDRTVRDSTRIVGASTDDGWTKLWIECPDHIHLLRGPYDPTWRFEDDVPLPSDELAAALRESVRSSCANPNDPLIRRTSMTIGRIDMMSRKPGSEEPWVHAVASTRTRMDESPDQGLERLIRLIRRVAPDSVFNGGGTRGGERVEQGWISMPLSRAESIFGDAREARLDEATTIAIVDNPMRLMTIGTISGPRTPAFSRERYEAPLQAPDRDPTRVGLLKRLLSWFERERSDRTTARDPITPNGPKDDAGKRYRRSIAMLASMEGVDQKIISSAHTSFEAMKSKIADDESTASATAMAVVMTDMPNAVDAAVAALKRCAPDERSAIIASLMESIASTVRYADRTVAQASREWIDRFENERRYLDLRTASKDHGLD